MANSGRTALDLEGLVEHMFEHVLSAPERAELLVWIRWWEAANPDADAAHRVTGWIDVAYAFQMRAEGRPVASEAVRESAWASGRGSARFA